MKISKDQGIGAALSVIVSLGAAISVLWFVLQPLLISSISTAMAQDIKEIVREETTPLKGGFTVIIQQTILRLQREIAQLERKQRMPEGLTADETNTLVDLRSQLEAQRAALEALK